jgi:hypothetical protein
MTEPKYLKKIIKLSPDLPTLPKDVFYDMDNDAFFRWEGGKLIKYVREENENNKTLD